MRIVIFKTQNAIFKFDQKEVKKHIVHKRSKYDLDGVITLMEQISTDSYETIVIPDEPIYFDYVALDLIAAGYGSVFCKTCIKKYEARQLKPIKVGYGGTPFDIKREKTGLIKRLFLKKRKPPTMIGGMAYNCPRDHTLISTIWKTF